MWRTGGDSVAFSPSFCVVVRRLFAPKGRRDSKKDYICILFPAESRRNSSVGRAFHS